MIHRLRRKFILINMLLVLLVLLIVFGALFAATSRRLQNQTYDALRHSMGRQEELSPPKLEFSGGGKRPPKGENFQVTPLFWVTLDESGSIGQVRREFIEVDDQTVREAVDAAGAAGSSQGALPSMGLRYLIQPGPGGVQMAFADMSVERASLRGLLGASLLVGLAGLGGFFVISVFLSGWALRPVERAWEQQRQFVANASHELKTPLTVILANTGILLSHKGDTIAAQQKWVDYTRDEAERMKRLVDDLLFLAKADATRSPAPHRALNFSDVLWSSLLPFESVAFELGVDLQSHIAPSLTVLGDEGQLGQLAAILLDNACKYAGPGGRVTVLLERAQERARLSVRNTGQPIPPGELEQVFRRFYRVDDSRSRGLGGHGLGLSIAKTIVEGHRGKISVESSAKSGTTFVVTLPLKA